MVDIFLFLQILLICGSLTRTAIIDDNIHQIAQTLQEILSNEEQEALHIGVLNVNSLEAKDFLFELAPNVTNPIISWIIQSDDDLERTFTYLDTRPLDYLIVFTSDMTTVRLESNTEEPLDERIWVTIHF